MSSRTAAGRKKLLQPKESKEPKEPKESKSRGFFSRSKSVAPAARKENVQTYPSPPPSTAKLYRPTDIPRHREGYADFHAPPSPDIRVSRSETPRNIQLLQGRHESTFSSPHFKSYAGAYPSPPDQYHALPPKQSAGSEPLSSQGYVVKKAASTSNMLSSLDNQLPLPDQFPTPPPHIFLEASYQPPPPPRPRNGRPLPNNPMNGQPLHPSPYPPEKVPSPSTPHPSLPSPSRSPIPYSPPSPQFPEVDPIPQESAFQTSLLLRPPVAPRTSPLGLPDYGAPYPSQQLVRPQFRVTAEPETPQWDPSYRPMQRENVRHYPSPPPSDIGLGSGRNGRSGMDPPASGLGSVGAWYDRNLGPHEEEPVSPVDSTYVRARAFSSTASITSSSSRRSDGSHGSRGPESPATAAFVFPGSRSAVKAKLSSTTGKPKLNFSAKRAKSRAGQDTDDEPVSPVPVDPTKSPVWGTSSPLLRNQTSMGQSINSGSSGSSKIGEGSGTNSNASHTGPLTRPRKMSTATADTTNTSTSSTSSRSNPGFVYPGGRSRAHPNAPPLSLKFGKKGSSKHSRKSSGSSNGRTKFMGITIKKKKSVSSMPASPPSPLAHTLLTGSEFSGDDYEGSQIGSTTSGGGPAGPAFEAYRDQQLSPELRMQERVRRIKSRIGSYPLDPYDTILLDNDRHTGDLLNRLKGTGNPSFYEYGNDPPATVLDLGCGQGHWVVDAAIAWKGHGTKVTGYDMVDISKVLLPWAVKQGVADNIRFVRGNFLKQRLPFSDNSFDLVRMSSLTLAITADAWIFVFQEVCRVLTIGGRLELIDDSIIFPYGKPTSTSISRLTVPSTPRLNILAPRLDINIPSSAFSTFCIYNDSDHPNPGLGYSLDDEEEETDLLDLYQVREEGESDLDDTATLSGREPEAQIYREPMRAHDPRETPVPRNRSRTTQGSTRWRSWNQHVATSRDLESLFEHMLTHKFGMHMRPEEFVLDLMKDVFGHAREVRTMHLSLAPPDVAVDDDAPRGRRDDSSKSHDRYGSFGSNFKHIPSPSPARTVMSQRMVGTPLSRSPGLVLSPSTFIPMTQQELEIHASKHLRMLLSCKKFLVEHAMEATEDEEIDEDSVLEALWEYEGFLRARFNNPPDDYRDGDKSPSNSDAASTRGSIMSVSSDGQDAMWEYQSELRQRFAWPLDGADSPATSRSQITPKIASSSSGTIDNLDPTTPTTGGDPAAGNGRSSPASSIAPPYSRSEMTHVRTLRVYEAIKLDEAIFGVAA